MTEQNTAELIAGERDWHKPVNIEPSETVCRACSVESEPGEFSDATEWPCDAVRLADALDAALKIVPSRSVEAERDEAVRIAKELQSQAEAYRKQMTSECRKAWEDRDAAYAVIEDALSTLGFFQAWRVTPAQLKNLHHTLSRGPAEALREVKAQAWDEGYRFRCDRGPGISFAGVPLGNPYREEADRG